MKINITAIIAGLIIGSISYNLNADNETIWGIPSYLASWISISACTFTGAFLITIFTTDKTSRVALLLFVGIILSIIGRMVFDIAFTSTEHHLAPLELIVYSMLSLTTAFSGAFLGEFIRRKKNN